MSNTQKALEMKEKIVSELRRIKRENSGSGKVIDDLVERTIDASKKSNAMTEYCTILMNGAMALGMFGLVKKSDFTAIQDLNKECAELVQSGK